MASQKNIKTLLVAKLISLLTTIEDKKTPANVSAFASGATETLNSSGMNHFVIFTKPEILLGANVAQRATMLSGLLEVFESHTVKIDRVSVMNGQHLQDENIVDRCYERLAEVSMVGLRACAESHREAILKFANQNRIPVSAIYGGHQFLKQFQSFSSKDLLSFVDSAGCEKFGAGVYGSVIEIEKCPCLLLNGFYPAQKAWLSQDTGQIVVFSLYCEKTWQKIRSDVVGQLIPGNAKATSIRGMCYSKKEEFGIPKVDIAHNCVHFAANPVDAYYYINLFFGADVRSALADLVSKEQSFSISDLKERYYAKDLRMNGKVVDLRDLLEDTCMGESLSVVRNVNYGS